jgi:ABC-type antimicrobial peptide transport system permease subunit
VRGHDETNSILAGIASHFISDSVWLPFVFEESTAAVALAAAVTLNLAFSVLPSRKAASVSRSKL